MAVFDPGDWRSFGWWPRTGARKDQAARPAAELLRDWSASVAFCLCFAALGPPESLGRGFGLLMLLSAFAWLAVAAATARAPRLSRVTEWDLALLSATAGLGFLAMSG